MKARHLVLLVSVLMGCSIQTQPDPRSNPGQASPPVEVQLRPDRCIPGTRDVVQECHQVVDSNHSLEVSMSVDPLSGLGGWTYGLDKCSRLHSTFQDDGSCSTDAACCPYEVASDAVATVECTNTGGAFACMVTIATDQTLYVCNYERN